MRVAPPTLRGGKQEENRGCPQFAKEGVPLFNTEERRVLAS